MDRMNELIELMVEHEVKNCFYGHLHGWAFQKSFEGMIGNISFKLISADYLDFMPVLIERSNEYE